MGKKRITWPPKAMKPNYDKKAKTIWRKDGEPIFIDLDMHEGCSSPQGHAFITCCDCGLTHTYVLTLERTDSGKFYLIKQAYRHPNKVKRSK